MRRFKVLLEVFVAVIAAAEHAVAAVSVSSPDGRVQIELSLGKDGDVVGAPRYRVVLAHQTMIDDSRLGVDLNDGTALGGPCEILSVDRLVIREEFQQVSGKRSRVQNLAREATVRLRETIAPRRTWEVVLRAYDDGVAFRYRFLPQEGFDALAIRQERTEFRIPGKSLAFALPLNGYTTSYETRYKVKPVGELPQEWLLGLPLLIECPGGKWLAITEANLDEYAGLYLAPSDPGTLSARLSPLPNEPRVAVRHSLPHTSPWRVLLVADRVGRLVESDIVLNLNEPCAINDTSWVKTGKTTFPWWNGFYEEGVPFKPGLNTATAIHYIDFCAMAGIPYHSLDGIENTAWYGGPIVPYEGADPTKAVDGLDLQAVLQHAKAKGVRIRLWMNWQAARAHMERAFPLYREWGIEGVMLDFMDRDDQEMNRFVRRAVALAADNQLTVTLHGCPKPTGLERTYPNLLTHEAVMNLEYDKWDQIGITPDHEVTVPFTRMLAGPLDFHQGSFRTVRPEAFKPRNDAPLVMGTPARTLASYVVFQNHLSMVADYPTAYQGHPGLPVLAAIPTTWDETRVLDARVGEYIVIARRSGEEWHIGAMTNSKSRSIEVSLQVLGAGEFSASICLDTANDPSRLIRSDSKVSKETPISLDLSAGGGAYLRIVPSRKP